jgi:hypothetical protein
MSDEDKTMMVRRPAPTLDWAPKKPKARLVCVDDSLLEESQKGLSISLSGGEGQVLGRDSSNPIVIESSNVSRKHALIYSDAGGWGVRDLKSTNGVFVNGKQVSEARLSPGDMLKLGDIPFRFELEAEEAAAAAPAPEPPAAEEDETDKTMMFGDVRAASKLLAAQDESADAAEATGKKAQKAPAKPDAKPTAKPEVRVAVKGGHRRGADETTVLQVEAGQARAKFPVVKTLFFAAIGVLIVGGAYFAIQMMMASNIVESNRDAVNRFVREAAVNIDPKQFGQERKTLAKLRQELLAAIGQAPDAVELPALLDRVLILEFERDFYEAVRANNLAAARQAIDATRRRIAGLKPAPAGAGPGAHADAEAMLAAMETAIPFAEFSKAFPDPQQKAPAPTPAQLDELLKRKIEFSKLHKTVNMDLVRHPYLARLLDETTQDIRLVERWELALRRASR